MEHLQKSVFKHFLLKIIVLSPGWNYILLGKYDQDAIRLNNGFSEKCYSLHPKTLHFINLVIEYIGFI